MIAERSIVVLVSADVRKIDDYFRRMQVIRLWCRQKFDLVQITRCRSEWTVMIASGWGSKPERDEVVEIEGVASPRVHSRQAIFGPILHVSRLGESNENGCPSLRPDGLSWAIYDTGIYRETWVFRWQCHWAQLRSCVPYLFTFTHLRI